MHVEQQCRLAAHRVQADRTGTVIGDRAIEASELRAQVVEDASGVDRTRRIARVERDQRAQVLQGIVE